VTFEAGVPGTYFYWATSSSKPLQYRVALDSQLSGAIIVDPRDGPPTTDRTFAPGAPIVAAMRVYQAKQPLQPVTVKASILDGKDKVVVSSSQQLEVGPFTSEGFGTYRYPLPLAQLGTGPFLLRLEVSRPGAPAVIREVRFAVK
jgi:hypothetical protein